MFFSEAHGNSSKIDNVLVHKTSLYRYRKTEITSCIPPAALSIDINNERKGGKHTYSWKLNNTLLNQNQVKEEIQKEI